MTVKCGPRAGYRFPCAPKPLSLVMVGFTLLGFGGSAVSSEQGTQTAASTGLVTVDAPPTRLSADARSATMPMLARNAAPPVNSTSDSPFSADEPVAVIELSPMSDTLSPEMEARLSEVAEAAKADERITLTLEGFVPDGGSPVLNIGLAEQSLAVVRKKLIGMRVPASRIQVIPFGEHHNRARSQSNHWVEVFSRIRDR